MSHVVLDRFELVAPFDEDGVIRRWVARNREPEADEPVLVAVTGFPDGVASSDRIRQLARYEAGLAEQLDHPSVARTFDYGLDGGRLFFVTDLPIGESLATLWEKALMFDERVPIALALRAVYEAIGVVDHAHTQKGADGLTLNVVHGGLSPGRIILRPSGQLLVTDFAIGKLLQKINDLTDGMASPTSLSYRAPEQVQEKVIGPSTDVFLIGEILWELLAMRRLYPEELENRDIAIAHETPEPPSNHNAAVTGTLDKVVLTALAKQPSDRYSSAADFASALRPFLDAMPLHGTVEAYLEEQFIDRVGDWRSLEAALDEGNLRDALVAAKGTLI
jgi:serine/threonine-protein kinase